MTFVREEDITILRHNPPVLDIETGRYQEQSDTEAILRGNIQPVSGEMFSRLPEGIHFNDVKTLFLHEALKEDDKISYKNKTFKIHQEIDWDSPSATIRHYVYLIKKEAVR